MHAWARPTPSLNQLKAAADSGCLSLCRAVPCCAVCAGDLCGRYIISQPSSISAKFITDTLKAAMPEAAALPDGQDASASHINSSRVVEDLGLQYTPVASTIKDMAASLLKCGIAKPEWYTVSST